MRYNEWLAEVNRLLNDAYGMGIGDFAHWPSYDEWSAGTTPEEALEVIAEWDDMLRYMGGAGTG